MKKLFLLLCMLWSVSGRAQESVKAQSPPLVDKLTNHIYSAVYSAGIVPEGLLQVDMELVYLVEKDKNRSALTKFRSASLPDLKLRYGITPQLEIRAGTRIGYAYQRVDLSPATANDPVLINLHEQSVIHTDYIVLGLKASVFEYNQQKGLFSILAESSVPVLRPKEAFGPAFQPTLTLINSNQFNHWLGYNINAAAIFSQSHQRELVGAYNLSIVPTFKLTKTISSYGGVNTIFHRRSQPAYYKGFMYIAGLLYAPTPSLQLRGSFSHEKRSAWNLNTYNYNLGIAFQPGFW